MHSYISHKHKLVVFWSPKAGCTSVVNWFCENVINKKGISIGEQRSYLNKRHLKSFKEAVRLCKFKKYKSVAFVRDPRSRCVSAYLNKFLYRGPHTPIYKFRQLEIFSKRFYKQYSKKNKVKTYNGISFYEYLKFIKYRRDNKKWLNQHWSTQSPCNFFKVDYLVKIESFKEDLTTVNADLRLNNFIPSKLRSINLSDRLNFKNADSDLLLDKVPSVKLLKKKLIIKEKNLLSEECLDLINDIYKCDFINFSYN